MTDTTTKNDPIRFYHQGRIVEVSDVEPTRTLLDWLRDTARCRGTKEGCAEGDCGACTVIVAELPDESTKSSARSDVIGGLSLRPINACIKFLPTLDGCAILTVEDLEQMARLHKDKDSTESDPLHPVQQAMVDAHGSQCGFCTPGFIMSLTATYERHLEAGTHPTRGEISDDIAGNLCRCTGYRPILEAGSKMFDLPTMRIDTASIIKALKELKKSPTTRYENSGRTFWAPRTLDEFAAIRMAHPQARLLAGATDIGLWVNKQMKDIGDILYCGAVDELKHISKKDDTLLIGAGVSLEDAWLALVNEWPCLRDIWRRFASPPIRHAGTLGGNLANGSPIGDGPPILMALGASVVLRHGKELRQLLLEDFYLDYMKNAMQPGEFVQAISVPLPSPSQVVRAYKISKRFDSDISAVCAAFAMELEEDGRVRSARFSFGGMAATVKRADRAEAAVTGQLWNEHTLRQAQEAIASDFTPLTDLRASAEYRNLVVKGLLERFWLETRNDGITPMAAEDVSVFAAIER